MSVLESTFRRPLRFVRAGVCAASLWACGSTPETPPTHAVTSVDSQAVAAPPPPSAPSYPTSIPELAAVVPREAVGVVGLPGMDAMKKAMPALDDVLSGDLATTLGTKWGLSRATFDHAMSSFDGATAFALDRNDGRAPDFGFVVRFKDSGAVTEVLSAIGAKKLDEIHYEGPREMPLAFLDGAHVLVIGTRAPVVEAALATASQKRPSFTESPLYPKGSADGLWFSADLATLANAPEVLAQGSRVLGVFSSKGSTIEVDAYGSRIPRLGSLLAPTSHELMGKLPTGAAGAFDFAIERRPGKTMHDVLSEAARQDERTADLVESLLKSFGTNVADLDRGLGSDIAFAVYPGKPGKGTPQERFEQSGAVVIAIATKDDIVAKNLVDAVGKRQKGSKGVTVSPGKLTVEMKKGAVWRTEAQKGAVVFGLGATKTTQDLLAAFAAQKNTLASSPAFVSYRKSAAATSFAALFADPAQILGALPEAKLPAGTSFGLDMSLKPNEKGIELEVKGDAVIAVVGVGSALAIYGVRQYLTSSKVAEAKNSLGAMARGAVGAFERESASTGPAPVHKLCKSSTAVPATVPKGVKYAPTSEKGKDYDSGDEKTGWRCLKFEMSSPQYYQYEYRQGGNYKGPARGGPNPGPGGFEVSAEGDLDGNGKTSLFTMTGKMGPKGFIVLAPDLFVSDENE